MRKLRTMLIVLGLALFLCGFAQAEKGQESAGEGEDVTDAVFAPVPPAIDGQAEAVGADSVTEALPGSARELLGELSLTDTAMGENGFKAILTEIRDSATGIFKNALGAAAKMLAVILLCTAACSAMNEGNIRDMVNFGGVVAVSALAAGNVNSFIGLGMETLTALSDYSKALLPTMCAAAASAGAFTSASAKYAATALFMDVLITISVNIILPLISIYLAAVIANAALSKDSLANVAKLLKWGCTTALTMLMLAFTAYLGVSGLVTGKADALAASLTKSALGTALPVVGGILSGTAETLVAGAGMLRNAIGVFDLFAVVAVCLAPFLNLGRTIWFTRAQQLLLRQWRISVWQR